MAAPTNTPEDQDFLPTSEDFEIAAMVKFLGDWVNSDDEHCAVRIRAARPAGWHDELARKRTTIACSSSGPHSGTSQ